jgi:hypothetical protein
VPEANIAFTTKYICDGLAVLKVRVGNEKDVFNIVVALKQVQLLKSPKVAEVIEGEACA